MRLSQQVQLTPEMHRAQMEYEMPLVVQNYRIACLFGIIFMPFGGVLDYLVYPRYLEYFLWLRLECSVLLCMIWWLLGQPFGRKFYRPLGLIEVILPIFFLSWMIFETEGMHSDYYAGINLVLVGVGFLMRWGLADTTRMVFISILLYLGACLARTNSISSLGEAKDLLYSLYFIVLTGIISMTGNFLYNLNRTREFALRFELDENRRQLEKNNRKLQELDRVKNRFFANISHELRTPLTLLLTPLESLIAKGQNAFAPDVRETLHAMQANGMRLLKLINDLLDLVRLESGKLKITAQELKVESFVKGIIASVRKAAEDRGIKVQADIYDTELVLQTDGDKLEKVLLNLIFNAVKFTSPGGVVRVSAYAEEGQVIIEVADTGIGIPQESLAFIFDRFWQVDNSSKRKHQGAGIGLALVKEFVELLKGTVDVRSEEGKGTEFIMRFPTRLQQVSESEKLSQEADDSEVSAAPTTGEKGSLPLPVVSRASGDQEEGSDEDDNKEWLSKLYRRAELFPVSSLEPTRVGNELPVRGKSRPLLLVADDEPDMVRFLRSQLETHYEIMEAQDGQEAIDKARQFLPDIILTDMMMPEKDGLQVCQELRRNTSTENIPIILLTARVDEDIKLSALQSGASDFLTKPFSLAEIHVRLKNLSDSYLFQRSLARQKKKLEVTLEELKETETQLVQSEKMASLGKMSAGILHEINNPLNFAKTGSYTLREFAHQLPEQDREDFRDILKDVEEGITRVSEIVKDLRGFSHPDNEQKTGVSLELVIMKSIRLLSNEVKHFEVNEDVPEGLEVYGNENQLVQVLVNLLQNASDSLNSKEFADDTDSPTIRIKGFKADGRVHLLVRDNGQGIDDAHLTRIFDPFYTTKDVGEGMGLGLSICYKIMENHQGTIKVKTEHLAFTEFDLIFPDPDSLVNDKDSTE
jgi:signal transduction histidine kinase